MAHILKGYGSARENHYFKEEQEAEIQLLAKKVMDSGLLRNSTSLPLE